MKYINTYLNAVEELPDGFDPTTTTATHLGYLPPCADGREYQGGDADTMPQVWRKPVAWFWAASGNSTIRWSWEPQAQLSKSVVRRLAAQRGQR